MTETPEPALKDRNLRFVVLKAIVDAGTAELGNLREEHLPALLSAYKATEASSFKVRAPGVNGAPGPVVATVSLSVPKSKIEIHDEAEFLDWVQANHPDLVIPAEPERTVVIPATERCLDPKAWATLVKHFDEAEEGGIVDKATGAMVDGVIVNPGGDPKSFAVKYEAGAAEQLLASYRAGRLDAVVAGTSLPEVASRVVVERHLQVAPPSVMGEGGMVMPTTAAVDLDPRDENEPECGCGGRHAVCPAEQAALDLVDASTPGRLNGVPAAPEPDFDPGDWGAPSHAADPWG